MKNLMQQGILTTLDFVKHYIIMLCMIFKRSGIKWN